MKTALITGASRGIGKSIALQLARDGYNIVLNYKKSKIDANKTKKEIESLGRKCIAIATDVTNTCKVKEMIEKIKKEFVSLDLLVNNAGYDYGYMFEDYTLEQMKYVMDIVLWSKMTVTKFALPLLKKSKQASIINISSRMGKEKTVKTISIYGPAQAGVIKFTQCCALEFADSNIRVNCVAPGLTYTDINKEMFIRDTGSEENANELWKEMAKRNPLKRVGQPQDIANVVSFLASDKANYINGETLGVNGGSNLG